jgi:hypothetical protein
MPWSVTDDPILRENRRLELVRRLISHGVRTGTIDQLTGFSRNRQETVRECLGVTGKSRWNGPARSTIALFLDKRRRFAEAAALVTLCSVFDIPIDAAAATLPDFVSLNFTDRLCETYEAYRALVPETLVELEELILLRSSVARGEIRLSHCCVCHGLILIRVLVGEHTCGPCARWANRRAPR